MIHAPRTAAFVGVLTALTALGTAAQSPSTPPPAGFTRFVFPGHEDRADLLSRYLWYHFVNRLGNQTTLFNQEYTATSDMWLGGAIDPHANRPIQDVHRDNLTAIRVHEDGYVDTHQHFSHAYDYGWPFPLWTQSGNNPDLVRGVTVGWHFQTKPVRFGWVYDYVFGWKRPEYIGDTATKGWELSGLRSEGIVDDKWRLTATAAAPSLTTPAGMELDAFNAPYVQLRWICATSGTAKSYVEWLREGDSAFGPDRHVAFDLGDTLWQHVDGTRHAIITMHTHPLWRGKIKRLRLTLGPVAAGATVDIDSFFTCYDTRHTINNPIFVMACWDYFRWTGDLAFLRANLDRMRTAVRYEQTVMGGLKHQGIRNEWPGHDGLPGWGRKLGGGVVFHAGHGIGANYWDLLPFGWDDLYATNQYHRSLLDLADAEEAARKHPEWHLPASGALDPRALRKHAAQVRATANRRFWDEGADRFIGCIDKDGKRHDYGFTFLNLDAIWYGLASPEHARQIMDWISGKRIVEGDTSTGADIYRWRFGPRATTKRNIEWYGQGWSAPEGIGFGGQIQDGGAVLGFAFYDLWARLHVLGPDDAWTRLGALLDWQQEVEDAGGYRKYYSGLTRGKTLQGAGTAGGIGIDAEFYESSLVPAIVTRGFLGLVPTADALRIEPRLPRACPRMGIAGLLYRGVLFDIAEGADRIDVVVKSRPADPIHVQLAKGWRLQGSDGRTGAFVLREAGEYRFTRGGAKE